MIRFTSFLAASADLGCEAIVSHIAQQLDIQAIFVGDIPYAERWRQFDAGQIEGAWICGLPYVQRVDEKNMPLDLLAAPVMQAARYNDQPIYFSDVVVHRESRFYRFADLRGASWAFNEPGSHSGYNLTRYHLAQLNHIAGYFGRVIQSGAHQASIKMVLEKEVDASAVDSTVLDTERRLHPEISRQLRIVERMGPSPIPPWVINKSVPHQLREKIRQTMITMHLSPSGPFALASGQIKRLTRVEDHDYNFTRQVAREAEPVTL